MKPLYSKRLAAEKLGISRQALDAYHMPHLVRWEIAEEVAPSVWAFFQPDFDHYAEYVAAAAERKEAGTLPGNYGYNRPDMEACIDGSWED